MKSIVVCTAFHIFFFFFFQAEDGIRDRTVTGVQTCALPILWASLDDHELAQQILVRLVGMVGTHPRCTDHYASMEISAYSSIGSVYLSELFIRSEERRVGKECRYRWWLYHQNKKEKK